MRCLFLLLIPFTLLAQPKGWQELTISDGLSQGMIFDLAQDRQGFLWIATKDGLNRYDGYNFIVFTHDSYNEHSISDNNCSALLIDRRGWLWVGTLNGGVNLFNTRTQEFYHLDVREKATSAGNYAINSLYEDPQGNVWAIANESKLIKITVARNLTMGSADTKTFTSKFRITQVHTGGQTFGTSSHLSFSPDGQALVVCTRGLFYFNWTATPKAVRFIPFENEPADFLPNCGNARSDIWFAFTGNTIIASRRGIRKTISFTQSGPTPVIIRPVNATTVAVAKDGLLWLLSPDELYNQVNLSPLNAYATLPPNIGRITRLFIDRTGTIWLGTNGYGLRKFNPRVRQFQVWVPTTSPSYLYVDRQAQTYVRHEYAYEKLDRSTNRLVPFLSDALPPADKRQRYLMQDRQGFFWVSNTHFQTHQMQLFRFSSDWKLLKKYPLPPTTSFGFYSNQTVEDKNGKLWIGAINGKLLRFDPETETFHVFSYESLLPQKGADIETHSLYFDRTGTLWIGTTRGMIRADHPLNMPTFSIYKNSTANRQSLSNDIVLSLLDDPIQPSRYLWVGTKGGGLDRLDKQTGQFVHFTEKQGLPNKVVYGILPDEFRNLWLSTNRGLAQFNPATQTFRNFTKADGLQDDEFNTGSFTRAPSGELLFGGVQGLTIFRAASVIRPQGSAPQVRIIGLKVNNEPVEVGAADNILSQGIEYTEQLDLAHDQNLVTFEFGVMDFTNPAKNRYRYRLQHIDRDWVDAGTNRFANYAQLPSGSYTLQMIGSADGEHWSQPVSLQLRVHPPFYRTWWAYLVYVLVLTFAGWQVYRFQSGRLLLQQQVLFEQKEAGRLAELDALKTRFFTNISHEFRTPLTLILGPLTNRKRKPLGETDLVLMERNGQRLMSLINQLLDLSKLEAGGLKPSPEPGDIAQFFRTVASSFQSLADSRGIRFTFMQDQQVVWASFERDKLEKVVTNLLSNAFKFTPGGQEVCMEVGYRLSNTTAQLTLTVADTGIGIPSTDMPRIFDRFYQRTEGKSTSQYEGTGIGLALVHELVKVLNGSISVTSIEGVGTTFTVALPLLLTAEQTQPAPYHPASVLAQAEPALIQATTVAPNSDRILLIIDDNADIRTYVRSVFEADYQIEEAEDGQQGLERATALTPDLVICDLMMPRLDGFGFCKALKTQDATSHIPVVMLTAKATVQDRIEGFELGADDYLTKPFQAQELGARVRNLLDKQERLRHYFGQQPVSAPVVVQADAAVPAMSREDIFLQKARQVLEVRYSDSQFGVEEFSQAMGLSPSQLLRKLRALTAMTAVEYLRRYRLEQAAYLLTTHSTTVSDVAFAVGFESLPYFTNVFQKHYGMLPSKYTPAPASNES
ncbi:histidine kinase [Fibrisoma limi BUZ 3]|uniref:histidine kinase n=1 Tax=Fibrisoma limi BUZ 3 TaxID=1185876 RepID=I2GK05_9BACT|nr:response regulator [Fibrisoma limi]CCH54230.1 histidine kinase [Fibrisoma limi BUZ 3]